MEDSQTRTQEMLTRAENFCLKEHAADFAAGTLAGELAQEVRACVAGVNEQAGAQAAARRLAQASTDRKDAARDALRASLERLYDTAGGMEATRPGVRAQFRLPARKDDALAAAARAALANAAPLKDEFFKRELPPDFFTKMEAQLEEFERARAEQDTHADMQVAATARIRDLLARGVNAVRQLEPIVRNKYRADPAALAAWRSASRVERAPQRKAGGAKKKTGDDKQTGTPPAQS
ncbi:MAG TPA: hypothetical protein VF546_21070 [Pyrinomonadaceae bacterium]|jgi:hypothetical protein